MPETAPIPAFVNPRAANAASAARRLAADRRFVVRRTGPRALRDAIAAEAAGGARRVLVCGGDGTLATAAAALVGTGVGLAIVPGGTLNHFARDHGIPTELDAALEAAAHAPTRTVDVGFVNDRLFLNTSSVGAYVDFVRVRERFERWLGYGLASFVAGARILIGLRSYTVAVEVDDGVQHYATPLVFAGVGERELTLPSLGSRVPGGRRALHLLVVSGRAPARMLALALTAVARGVRGASRSPRLDSFLIDAFTVTLPRRRARVAVDGEVAHLPTPLHYRIARDALLLVSA